MIGSNRVTPGLCVTVLVIVLLSNLLLDANYNLSVTNQSPDAFYGTRIGFQLPSLPRLGTRSSQLQNAAPQMQSLPDPPFLAHAPCSNTLSGGPYDTTISTTQEITGSASYTHGVLITAGGKLIVNGSSAILTAHRIVLQSTGILEVIRGATVKISQDSQLTGGIAAEDSSNLTMANSFFSATNSACILMNATSTANIVTSSLYSTSFTYSLVLSGHAQASIDNGNSLGNLELRGYAEVTVDSQKISANTIHGLLIIRDHAEATVHGSSTPITLVFNGTGISSIDSSLGLHPFANETRELGSSNLPVSWDLNLTFSNVPAWNLISEEQATLILTNSIATGNITTPLNIESFNTANTTLLANSSVSNIYSFDSSTIQVNENPGNTISSASLGTLQLSGSSTLTLSYIHRFSVSTVIASANSQVSYPQVSYLNSPANGTSFQISGGKFTLQNSTALWSKLAISGSAVFLAQGSKVLNPSSQPADVAFSGSVTAVFVNTGIASITTSGSANANVTNPGMALGEVQSKDSSTLIITNTNILKASAAVGTSHLTITNSTPPDIDAFGGAFLTLNHVAVGIVTDNDVADVNVLHSNVTTLLVCILSCPPSTVSAAAAATVSDSILTTAIIAGPGNLSINKSTTTAILAGAFGGTLALTDSSVAGRLSFNGGSSVQGTLDLNGKIIIQAITIASVPNLLLEGGFSWNMNRGNISDIIQVSGDTTVHRMFRLRYVDSKTGASLPGMEPYIPGKCVPTDNTNNPCYMGSKFGSDTHGYINFTVSFVGSSEITSPLTLATNALAGGSVQVKGIRTSTTDYNSSTIAFSDDSVIAQSATEVFGVPTLQLGLGFVLIATILPMTINFVNRRKRSS